MAHKVVFRIGGKRAACGLSHPFWHDRRRFHMSARKLALAAAFSASLALAPPVVAEESAAALSVVLNALSDAAGGC